MRVCMHAQKSVSQSITLHIDIRHSTDKFNTNHHPNYCDQPCDGRLMKMKIIRDEKYLLYRALIYI